MQCTECGTRIVIPTTLKTVSCPRCGDTLLVTDGNVRRFYPALHMLPIDCAPYPDITDYPPSKWMLPRTRPVLRGYYECRFRTTEPNVLRLWWNGVCFIDKNSARVQMTEFLTWRGVMA